MNNWRRLNGEQISMPIRDMVEQSIQSELNQGNKLKICIGSDSQLRGEWIEFATVIVFIREKKGGYMFISNSKTNIQMGLRERMISEVSKSVEIAYHIADLLDIYKVELEVHADINTDPGFESNIALKEAMGYILGMGFVFKSKPDAFASSSCADKVV